MLYPVVLIRLGEWTRFQYRGTWAFGISEKEVSEEEGEKCGGYE